MCNLDSDGYSRLYPTFIDSRALKVFAVFFVFFIRISIHKDNLTLLGSADASLVSHIVVLGLDANESKEPELGA